MRTASATYFTSTFYKVGQAAGYAGQAMNPYTARDFPEYVKGYRRGRIERLAPTVAFYVALGFCALFTLISGTEMLLK
jgi:hypothetical protein